MIQIEIGDFRQLSDELADASVDLVLSDPVYQNVQDYADIARLAARILKPGGNCVLQCGHEHLPMILPAMACHLSFVWLLAVQQNNGNARIWSKRIFVSYKPWVWFFRNGKPRCGGWVRDSARESKEKTFHTWGDGTLFTANIIDRLTKLGDLVFDPCIGSGTTALACLQTGRSCIGYEINPATADIARARLASAQLPLPMPVVTQEALAF